MSLLKNIAQPEKRDIFMKNGNEGRDVLSDSREQRQENYTALRTKKTAGFVTVPSEKKVRCFIKECDG